MSVANPCLSPCTNGVFPLVFSMMDLSTIAMKGDTANEEDAAAAISTLNNLNSVVRDFSVLATDGNGC